MKIGVTGHQRLNELGDWEWVKVEVDKLLDASPVPIIGLTSLALGADQLFADAILQHQGSLEAIIPFPEYERTFSEGHERRSYQRLLRGASRVTVLQREGSNEECYLDAGKTIVDQADLLVAVWNGQPAAGLGGTGDIVKYAIQMQRKTMHINPITHTVSEISLG